MSQRFIQFVFILFSLLLFSCNNKEENSLTIDEYKSTIKIIGDTKNINNIMIEDLYVKIETSIDKDVFRYSTANSYNIIKSNSVEIEFPLLDYDERTNLSPPSFISKQVFVGMKKENSDIKGFFIIWNYHDDNDTNRRVQSLGLGNIKDSIVTNLELSSINKLFPDYNGIYKYFHCDTISINSNYSVSSDEFYKFIKFDNERLGMPLFILDQRRITRNIIL